MSLQGHDLRLYAALYLGTGLVTLLVVLAANWHRIRPAPQSLASLIKAANPETLSLWYRIRAKILAPLLGGTLMVLFWPVAPMMKLSEWWQDHQAERQREEDVFKVQRRHLLERLTVAQIEAREMVVDPLQAVPALPFGHLNSVWSELNENARRTDEFWAFTALGSDRWGQPDRREGYVLWRRGKPVGHIITVLISEQDLLVTVSPPGPSSVGEIEIPDFLRKVAD